MAIIDYLKTQFLEIIQWKDDSRDTLSFRFPDEDKEIKRGAQLIVRESQVAAVRLSGPVRRHLRPGQTHADHRQHPHPLHAQGLEVRLRDRPFKADVYFVNTRLFTGNKWGTANPMMMRDPDFGIVRVRAYGTYDFQVVDVRRCSCKEVAGTDDHFRLDEFADTMRSRIVSVFSDALAAAKVPVLDVAVALPGAGRGAAAADQSGAADQVRPRDDRASSSRTSRCRPRSSRRSTSARAWPRSAISTTT